MGEDNPIDQENTGSSQYINEDNAGALSALRRAAMKARRRALETSGSVAIWRDGKLVYESDPKVLFPDTRDDNASPT